PALARTARPLPRSGARRHSPRPAPDRAAARRSRRTSGSGTRSRRTGRARGAARTRTPAALVVTRVGGRQEPTANRLEQLLVGYRDLLPSERGRSRCRWPPLRRPRTREIATGRAIARAARSEIP